MLLILHRVRNKCRQHPSPVTVPEPRSGGTIWPCVRYQVSGCSLLVGAAEGGGGAAYVAVGVCLEEIRQTKTQRR